MTKLSKRVLALTVSVILASSAMLGGCGKIEGDYEDTAGEKKTIKENIISVFNSASNAGETITSAFAGETDTAYSAEITVDFGNAITEQAGVDLDTISVSSDSKIKNGNAQTVIKGKYGKETVATLDVVRDKETGNIYAGIPELSPAYMMVTESFITEQMSGMTDQLGSVIDTELEGENLPELNQLPEIPEFDAEQIDEFINKYYDVIVDSFPDAKDNGTYKGEIDEVDYEFTKKTLTVTNQDFYNMFKSLAETAKNDETLHEFIETYGAAQGVTVEDFKTMIDGELAEMEQTEVTDNSADIQLYYQDDQIAGFAMDMDDVKLEMFCYMTDTELCASMNITSADTGTLEMTLSAETDGYMTDVNAKFEVDDTVMTFEVEDFKVVDEETGMFKGTMAYSLRSSDGTSMAVELASESTAKKADLEITMDMNGENMMTVTFVGEETKATDVTIPSGQIFDMSDEAQMEAFGATVDAEGFSERLEKILGDDFGAISGMQNDMDYEDLMSSDTVAL